MERHGYDIYGSGCYLDAINSSVKMGGADGNIFAQVRECNDDA
jgi:hypothetical protein